MKRLYITVLLFCSTFGSSGCYIMMNKPQLETPNALQLSWGWLLLIPVPFALVGALVALATKDSDRRNAALWIAGAAAVIFFFLAG